MVKRLPEMEGVLIFIPKLQYINNVFIIVLLHHLSAIPKEVKMEYTRVADTADLIENHMIMVTIVRK